MIICAVPEDTQQPAVVVSDRDIAKGVLDVPLHDGAASASTPYHVVDSVHGGVFDGGVIVGDVIVYRFVLRVGEVVDPAEAAVVFRDEP